MNRCSFSTVAVVLASALGAFAVGCINADGCADTDGFVIENLAITFGPWDPATNTAGDFLFLDREQKVFLEFGATVAAAEGGTKQLPTFEYRVRRDAVVHAIADGRVTRFVFQDDTHDYEFAVRSTHDPSFEVGYDHVLNPTVSLGDTVRAGDVLGNPGPWDEQLGRCEIMINNTDAGLSYCPFAVFDPNLVEQYQEQVSQFMADWEDFKGDSTIYDDENHVWPGCTRQTIPTY